MLVLPEGTSAREGGYVPGDYQIPARAMLVWSGGEMTIPEQFVLHTTEPLNLHTIGQRITLPADARRSQPGSTWGVFTIASTIPIALFVGLYMYKIRPKRVLEASLIGATLTLAATFAGGWVSRSSMAHFFDWSDGTVVIVMAIYGFVAAVLPVWVLLTPRDYLSSFLKIGTIGLLIIGVIVANPKLEAPAFNHVFASGGPTVAHSLFPFLFITIMCGAISGFHSLVSSGTTPKMIMKESQARMIGYGAMQMEGLVAVVAMIAAAALPIRDYYAMNTDLAQVPKYHERIMLIAGDGVEHVHDYEVLTRESLRGRTGGAVTLRGRDGPHLRRGGVPSLDRRRGCPACDVEILVPLCRHVRGAVYPHHHRRRHAHRQIPAPGSRRAASTPRLDGPTGFPALC